ncbi:MULTISPECIES: hypothetical protein [Bacillus]|jgi:hypothetical protein|uniref:Group-specific protein n=11 Tax=Bacillus cereus group TaxID=86661 RepID=Q81GP3_BACCR|nr:MULTISPECIES: hypothetical protein [Bacillus]MBJ3787442.1 hypothetical protein [Bacillus sp. OA1]MBJ6721099.1 hypothetical protein [Bacillus sp. PR5]MCO4214667.1 hypothetical protein [Bacillus sp. 10017]MCX2701292.1 hypothetical protein [Bacillus sp. AS_5]MEB4842791.1 hypothetical protein [Paenibacillus jamilae]TKV48225.1 hypothetical protein C1I58_05715 [Bacillus sp. PIC28]CEY19785.1 Uncharacterised protein [Streptococcus pneumoniae]HCF32002.1 hypothetical protein [Bacillus sp. (in: fir
MLLRYGKHINYLATAFILVTFFGFLLSTTWLHYSTPTTLTLLKASFWTAVILTIIGFGREKSALTVILFGICTLAFIGLYTFAVIDYLYNPRP